MTALLNVDQSEEMAVESPKAEQQNHVPRWAWALMAVLLIIAVIAGIVAVLVLRGGPTQRAQPGPTAEAPTPLAPTATETSVAPSARADGCLGGPTDLDQAVITAQEQAPLTEDGAAAFAATVIRWAMIVPAPPAQAQTADRVLLRNATASARNLSGAQDPGDATLKPSTVDARYYVESYEPTRAVVSVTTQITGTRAGVQQGQADVSGSLTLVAVGGQWRLQDITDGRSVEDLQRVGTVYAGGC